MTDEHPRLVSIAEANGDEVAPAAPAIPGIVVKLGEDDLEISTADLRRKGPPRRVWRCAGCRAKGTARGDFAALGWLYDHLPKCPADPAVAAARQAAKERVKR